MTEAAFSYLQAVVKSQSSCGLPRELAIFDQGTLGSVHRELSGLQLIEKVLGTRHGFGWRLTQAGVTLVNEGQKRPLETRAP